MKRNKLVPGITLIFVAVVGAIVFAQAPRGAAGKSGVEINGDRPARPDVEVQTVVERKPLAYYVSSVRSDLFAPPAPPEPPKAVKTAVKATLPAAAVTIVDPFADYAYTGTVAMGGAKLALVENSKTKEGQYLKEGDSFIGGTITHIDDRTLGITVAGVEKTVAKTDNFSLTSLDKSAAFLTAPPPQPAGQQAVPGMPGAPGDMTGGRGGGRARFMNMTPEQQAQMRANWMNRAFNGGGGRRGGGFGGGGFGGGGMGPGF